MRSFLLWTLLSCSSCTILYGQVNFTSSNLPIIVINTSGLSIVDEPKITAEMGIIDNGPGIRNNLTDSFNDFSGKIGIEIRGSSSQMFPKKQYGIELRDNAGKSMDASLLGLPKKDDWVLFAPYNDKTLMRDVLAYKLARDQGQYASRSRYCEVVLNGQYLGVYVLLEKIKRDKNRVDIAKLDPEEVNGDDLTGGYIIKIDKEEGNGADGWTSKFVPPGRSGNQQVYFQIDYPKLEDIDLVQKKYINGYIDSVESVLYGDKFKDPVEGYTKYIDVSSFIDYFIINELTRNPDAYRISTFMYKKKDGDGGKLYMGPAWDFNLGFGNVDFCMKASPEGFVIGYNAICPEDEWLVPFWWARLFEDETFQSRAAERWAELRKGPYATDKIHHYIDSVTTVLNAESQQRNFQQWPVLGQYVWPNGFVGQTFQQEVDWMKNWIDARLAWLDSNIPPVVTGIETSKDEDFCLSVFPNPVKDELNMEYEIGRAGTVCFALFDLMGRKIDNFERKHQAEGKFTIVYPFQNMAAGIYLIQSQFDAHVETRKITKK